jgi:hypothetical protein
MQGEASDALASEMLCSVGGKAEEGESERDDKGVPPISGSGTQRVRHVVMQCGCGLLGHVQAWARAGGSWATLLGWRRWVADEVLGHGATAKLLSPFLYPSFSISISLFYATPWSSMHVYMCCQA